jgi:hypothetical protein
VIVDRNNPFTNQALHLDAGAPFGVAMSAGLALTFR